jgi:hypothetical protein
MLNKTFYCISPYQFTPLLNLSPLIFGFTPFGWLHSIKLSPLFLVEISFLICTFFICVQYSGKHPGHKTRPWSIHFHENQSNEIQVISCALTEMTQLLVTWHNFENVTTMQPETTGHTQVVKRSTTDKYGKVWPSEPFDNIQQDYIYIYIYIYTHT